MLARDDDSPLKTTPLHALHVASGGKMVPFAGYDMPVQFASGPKPFGVSFQMLASHEGPFA